MTSVSFDKMVAGGNYQATSRSIHPQRPNHCGNRVKYWPSTNFRTKGAFLAVNANSKQRTKRLLGEWWLTKCACSSRKEKAGVSLYTTCPIKNGKISMNTSPKASHWDRLILMILGILAQSFPRSCGRSIQRLQPGCGTPLQCYHNEVLTCTQMMKTRYTLQGGFGIQVLDTVFVYISRKSFARAQVITFILACIEFKQQPFS